MSEKAYRLERLIRRIEPLGQLRRWWSLTGGVSAQMMAMEVELPDGIIRKLVVRRHGRVDLRQNPCIAANEARLLRALLRAGLAVPVPRYVDDASEIFSTPCLVLDYIEGAPEFTPVQPLELTTELAAYVARIHQVDLSAVDLDFLPRQGKGFGQPTSSLDDSLAEGRIRDALASLWPQVKLNDPVLLHGDFWPGNVLWNAGQIVAVIDWEDARLGDPLVDVGNSRLELLWAYGIDAMEAFTARYKSLMPAVNATALPYWDLCAALRALLGFSEWKLDPSRAAAMRQGHQMFVAQALESAKL